MRFFADFVVRQTLEHSPQVLDGTVNALGFNHEEVVVGDDAGDQAHVDGHHIDFTTGGEEQHVLIGPDNGAGHEATQRVGCNVLEGDTRKVEEMLHILAQAGQQDE